MNTKHTATPWAIDLEGCTHDQILDASETIIADCKWTPHTLEVRHANAAFIVEACNAHEELIELARMVAGRQDDDGIGWPAVKLAEKILDDMGVQRWNGPLAER